MVEGNFSNRVQEVLRLAREEAIRLGSDYIGSEHLLLSLIREGEGIAIKIIRKALDDGSSINDIKKAIEDIIRKSGSTLTIGMIPLSKQSEKILRITYLEAKLYRSDIIGTEHVLLSLLRDEDNMACQILNQFGITYDSSRQILDEMILGKKDGIGIPEKDKDSKDVRILKFIYNRMLNVHNEKSNLDYMINFKRIITTLEEVCQICPDTKTKPQFMDWNEILESLDDNNNSQNKFSKKAVRSDNISHMNHLFECGYEIVEVYGDVFIMIKKGEKE